MSANDAEVRTRRRGLAWFAALNALAAWGGAVGLVSGSASFGAQIDRRLPFHSVVLAGLALATIVAVPLSLLAWSAWTGSPWSNDISFAVGLLLVGWIVMQIAVIRAFSPFQPTYLCIGAFFVFASRRVRRASHSAIGDPGRSGVRNEPAPTRPMQSR